MHAHADNKIWHECHDCTCIIFMYVAYMTLLKNIIMVPDMNNWLIYFAEKDLIYL